MQEMLHRSLFDNAISNYLIVFGIILLVWILKKRASKNMTRLVFYLFKRMGRIIDEKEFFNLVLAPLKISFCFLLYISMSSLRFPAILHVKIFKVTSEVVVDRLAVGMLIFFFFIRC